MRQKFTISLLVLLSCFNMVSLAQKGKKNIDHCSSDRVYQQVISDPKVRERVNELDAFTEEFREISKRSALKNNYIIPVIFHVTDGITIRENGQLVEAKLTTRVTQAQIESAIRILNEDFNAKNSDYDNVDPRFQDIRADVGIEFRLAVYDPEGSRLSRPGMKLYPGVEVSGRKSYVDPADKTKGTEEDGVGHVIKEGRYWKGYMNVWLTSHAGTEAEGSSQSGWAFLPGSVTPQSGLDGIVYNPYFLGDVDFGAEAAQNQPNMKRVMTHEVGHYLNLHHTFQGGCDDPIGDKVSDTPPTTGQKCDWNFSPCGEYTNVNNYMDYSGCTYMYTLEQKYRMLAALNSPISERNLLWQPDNLKKTIGEDTYSLVYENMDFKEVLANDGQIKSSNARIVIQSPSNNKIGHGLAIGYVLENGVDYTTTGLPAGLSMKLTADTDNSISVSLEGQATEHLAKHSLKGVEFSFASDDIGNGNKVLNPATTSISVTFRDPYRMIYRKSSPALENIPADAEDKPFFFDASFSNSGFYTWAENNLLELGFDYIGGKKVLGTIEAGTSGTNTNTLVGMLDAGVIVSSTATGGMQWMESNINDNDYRYHSIYKAGVYDDWRGKIKFTGLTFLNGDERHYGWARIEVSADGTNIIVHDLAFHNKPDEPVITGDIGDNFTLNLLSQAFTEAEANDGSIAAPRSIEILGKETYALSVGTVLTEGVHYEVENVPAGLSTQLRVRESKFVDFSLKGKANLHQPYHNVDDVKITFKDAAFTAGNAAKFGDVAFDFSIEYFRPFGIVYKKLTPELSNKTSEQEDKIFFVDEELEGSDFYTWAEPSYSFNGKKIKLIEFGSEFGTARQIIGTIEGGTSGTDTRTLVTMLQPGDVVKPIAKSGSQWVFSNININDYRYHSIYKETVYEDWAGKTAYAGVSFLIGKNRHYGWVKMEVSANGDEVIVKEVAYHTKPDEPITITASAPVANKSITYSADSVDFVVNQGQSELDSELRLKLNNETFAKQGTLSSGQDYEIIGLPAGVISTLTTRANDSLAISLSGTGLVKGDTGQFTLIFKDQTFAGNAAATVYRSDFTFDYFVNATKSYCKTESNPRYTGFYHIKNVKFEDINHSTGNNEGYNYYANTQSTSIVQGSTYSLEVTANIGENGGGDDPVRVRAWADWDNDGVFETEESVLDNTFYADSKVPDVKFLESVTVPLTAVTDKTVALRVMVVYKEKAAPFAGETACQYMEPGEVEDYALNITPSNKSVALDFTASNRSLSLYGSTDFIDKTTLKAGVSIVSWEWTFSGAETTSSSVQNPKGIVYKRKGAYDVRLKVTDDNGQEYLLAKTAYIGVDYSFCKPNVNRGGYSHVGNLTLGSINHTSAHEGTLSNYIKTKVARIGNGDVTPVSITAKSGGLSDKDYARTRVWIDWNYNNEFEDTESVFDQNHFVKNFKDEKVHTFNITNPQNAVVGDTLAMRVMVIYSGTNSVDPKYGKTACTDMESGEVEDYGLVIVEPISIDFSGDNEGKLLFENAKVNFTDLSTGGTGATITAWKWTFEGATPATSNDQNPTNITYASEGTFDVSLEVTNSYGNKKTISKDDFVKVGYLICEAESRSNSYSHITEVKIGSLTNSTSGLTGYQSFIDTHNVDAEIGSTIPVTVKIGTGGSGANDKLGLKVWADWNYNAVFEASEEIYANLTLVAGGPNRTLTESFDLNVPADAKVGNRVPLRVLEFYRRSGETVDACSSVESGEVEDYGLNITAPVSSIDVNIVANTSNVITGNDVLFSSSLEDADTYVWSVWKNGIDQSVANQDASDFTYNFSSAGNYEVKLRVIRGSATGEASMASFSVVQKLTASITPDSSLDNLKVLESRIFTANSNIAGSTYSWEVLKDGNVSPVHTGTGETLSYQFATAGNYEVKLTTSNASQTASASETFSVTKLENPATLKAIPELLVNATHQLEFENLPNGVSVQYYAQSFPKNYGAASVDLNGEITALKLTPSQATHYVVVGLLENDVYKGKNIQANLSVKLNPQTISVNTSSVDLKVGESFDISTIVSGNKTALELDNKPAFLSLDNLQITADSKGSGTITVRAIADDVYASSEKTISVNVSKQDPVVTFPSLSPITYGTALDKNLLSAGDKNGILGTFEIDASQDGSVLDAGTPSVKVWFKPTATDTYNEVFENVNITVSEAVYTLEANPSATAIEVGQQVGVSALSGGSVKDVNDVLVSGSFVFVNPSEVATAQGPKTVFVKLVPATANANYLELRSTVTITVNPKTKVNPVVTFPSLSPITYGTALDKNLLSAGDKNGILGTFEIDASQDGSILDAGTPSVKVWFKPTATDTYNEVFEIVNITVSEAVYTLETNPSATAIEVGQQVGVSTLSGGSVKDVNDVLVSGSFEFVNSTEEATVEGPKMVFVKFVPATANANYLELTSTVDVRVNAKTKVNPVVTFPSLSPITYGTALDKNLLSAGDKNGILGTFEIDASQDGSVLDAGTPSVKVWFKPTATDTYNEVFENVNITVSEAVYTLEANPSPTAIEVGQQVGVSALSGGSVKDVNDVLVSGSFVFVNPSEVATAQGPKTVFVKFVPTLADGNYSELRSTVTITVNPKTKVNPVVTFPSLSPITYGTALDKNLLSAGDKNGILGTFEIDASQDGSVLDAGTPSVKVWFKPTATDTYNEVFENVNITVSEAVYTLEANPSPTAIEVGQQVGTSTLSGESVKDVNGAVVSGRFEFVNPTDVATAQEPKMVSVKFVPTLADGNYSELRSTVTITVNPKTKVDPVVTFPSLSPITYGTALDKNLLSAGDKNGILGTFEIDASQDGSVLDAGTPSVKVWFKPTATDTYNEVFENVNITVSEAVYTLEANPSATAIEVGQQVGVSALSGGSVKDVNDALVSGSFVFVNPSEVATAQGPKTVFVKFVPATANANYLELRSTVTITVNPKTKVNPVVTFPSLTAITYGTALDKNLLSAGDKNGILGTFEIDASQDGSVLDAGTPSVKVWFKPTATDTYNEVFENVNITVSEAVYTLEANPSATAIEVGQQVGVSALSGGSVKDVNDVLVSGSFVFVNSSEVATAQGPKTVFVKFVPTTSDANYSEFTSTVDILVESETVDLKEQNITITPVSALEIDETANLDVSGDMTTLTYTSSDENVATVSTSGVITAIAEGTATVTVKAASNDEYKEANQTVSIRVNKTTPVVKFTLKKVETTDFKLGETYTFEAATYSEGAIISWSVSRDGVDLNLGSKRGRTFTHAFYSEGTYVVYAKASLSTDVQHAKSPALTVNLVDQSLSIATVPNLKVAQTAQLQVSGNETTLVYVSSNESVLTVSETGLVSAKGAGTATITVIAKANDKYKTATKTIDISVDSVELKEQNITVVQVPNLEISEMASLNVTGAMTTLTYTSSDESVATVDENGLVTAIAEGDVTITVNAEANIEYEAASATVSISVLAKDSPVLGKNDRLENLVSVYPNPTNGIFYLNLPAGSKTGTVEILTAIGSSLGVFDANQKSFDISDQVTGIYYLKVTVDSETVVLKLFVK